MMKRKEVEDALLDGFKDALKVRFATIAGNALSGTHGEAIAQMRKAMENLRDVYEDSMKIASDMFEE